MNSRTTTLPQTLLRQLQALPPEQRQQVIDFVEFLHQKYGTSQYEQAAVKQPRVARTPSRLGLEQRGFQRSTS